MDVNAKYSQNMDDNLLEYGKVGLRTLVLAEKTIHKDNYDAWHREFIEANTDIKDRDTRL